MKKFTGRYTTYTAEISTEFFLYIAMLQSRGVRVVFKP